MNSTRFNVWFAQMICYHASLLLKLSNDVEENPGPTTINEIVDNNQTISADFSQGDPRFGQNSGKQCVAMSLTSIVYSNILFVNIWDRTTMNTILVAGNSLYDCISRSIKKDLLLLTDVPEMVSIDNKIYCLQYTESFSGGLLFTTNSDPFVTLEYALNQVFSSSLLNYQTALLTIGSNTVAIFRPFPEVFKIFDSHSRDLNGMPSSCGICILTCVEGLQTLVQYFHLTSCCHSNIPFELKGVRCNVQCETQGLVSDKPQEPIQKYSATKRKRQNESPEQREARLAKQRAYDRQKRKNESSTQRQNRLLEKQQWDAEKRKNESVKERQERQHVADKRKNEYPEQRQGLLSKLKKMRHIKGKMSLKSNDKKGCQN